MTEEIRGETIRWVFDDGPTKGKTFEHTFHLDGSVTYRMEGTERLAIRLDDASPAPAAS